MDSKRINTYMYKELSPLLIEAIHVANKQYLLKPYTDFFKEKNLRHYNKLAKIQFQNKIVLRPNHNIVHALRSLKYIPYIVDTILKYGVPTLQQPLFFIKNKGELPEFCHKLEVASLFKVAGRESEIARFDSPKLYTLYKIKSANAFSDFINSSLEARQIFSKTERDYYQKKVIEDLGNPFNTELPQLILRLAHDLELQRCRPDEIIQPLRNYYDTQFLQSGYTFEPLWQFAKSCIQETGGSVITGYNEQLYNFTQNPMLLWEFLSTKEPFQDPLYCNSVKGNLNLNEVSRIIHAGDAVARVVTFPSLEFKMLSDPRYIRPIIETTKNRTFYSDQKNHKTEKVKLIARPRKPYESIESQPVVLSRFNQTRYRSVQGVLFPRSISFDKDRGKPKETPYTKKMPTSLVHINGIYTPYADSKLGFLYDDALLHQKGDKYLWFQNAGSLAKPWLNGLVTNSISKSMLQRYLSINPNNKINNELLRGLTRHGLRALFYSYDNPNRINLFYEYLMARHTYHTFPRIPLLLWEYHTGKIHFYDINLIRDDLAKKNALSMGQFYKINEILGVKSSTTMLEADLLIDKFIKWEYPEPLDHESKARELLFPQVIAVLERMKSLEELKALGFFCYSSGKILRQPVVLNCKKAHVVNFETLINQCEDLICPVCEEKISDIKISHSIKIKMYSMVANLIRVLGIKKILGYIGCTIQFNLLHTIFNEYGSRQINFISLVAKKRAEKAILSNNVNLLIKLLEHPYFKESICTSPELIYMGALSGNNQIWNSLTQHGVNVNSCDDDVGTPLHYAASSNHPIAIAKLITNSAKINSPNKAGITPIYLAAQKGSHEAVKELLTVNSLIIDLINPCDGSTPLFAAIKYGQYTVVNQLIYAGSNITHLNDMGDSVLHIAAEYDQEKIIALLLKHGAKVNWTNHTFDTPLMRAAAYGREKSLQVLLGHNKHFIDQKNIMGDTALHLAIKFGRINTVRILLANKASHESLNNDGESPLHVAIKFNRQIIIRELMEQGADYTRKNLNGETPEMIAEKNFDKSLLTCLQEEQIKRETGKTHQIRSSL